MSDLLQPAKNVPKKPTKVVKRDKPNLADDETPREVDPDSADLVEATDEQIADDLANLPPPTDVIPATNPDTNPAEPNAEIAVIEKQAQASVTAVQVNGTWRKGESVIKILAHGGGKLKVSFNIFNERTLNQGSADGVANIEGIEATFSPEVDGAKNKCKFTMKFTVGKLIVEQFGTDVDCGFGNGVSADGTYTKTSSAKDL